MPSDTLSPTQWDTTKVKAPLSLIRDHKDNLLQMHINRSVLQVHLEMVAQWKNTSPTSTAHSINMPWIPFKIYLALLILK